MTYNTSATRIGVMILQKVRKKKKTYFNAHFQYSLSKTTGLNKMWSLQSLAMLSVRVELVYMQYNISDSQARLCSDVLFLLF